MQCYSSFSKQKKKRKKVSSLVSLFYGRETKTRKRKVFDQDLKRNKHNTVGLAAHCLI